LQTQEPLHKHDAALFIESVADMIQRFAVKMLNKPVEAVFHFIGKFDFR
jgi:hypothetical protein